MINVHFGRLTDGLQSGGILDAVRSNPCQWRSVFVGGEHDEKVTARRMTELFKVNLSPEGSNRRRAEMRVIAYWRDWLIEVEGEDLSSWFAKMYSKSHVTSNFCCINMQHYCQILPSSF